MPSMNTLIKLRLSDYHICMKYRVYQIVKYSTFAILLTILVIYFAKTDRLPRFLPDDLRNTLVDASDYILSYEAIKTIYTPLESALDFLADDGYTHKYRVLPRSIVDRLDKEINAIENSINLFLNNPLFETWIVPNLVLSDGILEETFKNYFPEEFHLGFQIYSSKLIEIFSLNVPKDETIKHSLNSTSKIKLPKNYFLKVRKLSKDLDFIEGFFVLVMDKNRFFDFVLGNDKRNFELIYIVQGNEIVYSSKSIPNEHLRQSISSETISIFGKTFRQKTVPYEDIKISFVIPNPTWVRWLNIGLKILILSGIVVLLFYANKLIKNKLKQAEDIKQKIIKELKRSISSSSTPKSDVALYNMLVKTTEENLKFFESFVKHDIDSTKKTKKVSIFR